MTEEAKTAILNLAQNVLEQESIVIGFFKDPIYANTQGVRFPKGHESILWEFAASDVYKNAFLESIKNAVPSDIIEKIRSIYTETIQKPIDPMYQALRLGGIGFKLGFTQISDYKKKFDELKCGQNFKLKLEQLISEN